MLKFNPSPAVRGDLGQRPEEVYGAKRSRSSAWSSPSPPPTTTGSRPRRRRRRWKAHQLLYDQYLQLFRDKPNAYDISYNNALLMLMTERYEAAAEGIRARHRDETERQAR